MKALATAEVIEQKIYLIRGHKVMIDNDLAELYGVEVKQLKRQVRRNIDRFPTDFMFSLLKDEYESLRRHIGTLKRGEHSKYLPYAFTEQGVAMLSSVLRSKRLYTSILPLCGLLSRSEKSSHSTNSMPINYHSLRER